MESTSTAEKISQQVVVECCRIYRKRLFFIEKKKCVLIISKHHELIEIDYKKYSNGDINYSNISQTETYSLCEVDKIGIKINEKSSVLKISFLNKTARSYEMDTNLITKYVELIEKEREVAIRHNNLSKSINKTFIEGKGLLMQSYYMITAQLNASFEPAPSKDIVLDMVNVMTQAVDLMNKIDIELEDIENIQWLQDERARVHSDYHSIVQFVQNFLNREDVQKVLDSNSNISLGIVPIAQVDELNIDMPSIQSSSQSSLPSSIPEIPNADSSEVSILCIF